MSTPACTSSDADAQFAADCCAKAAGAQGEMYGPEVFQVEHKLMQKAVVFFLWAEGVGPCDIERRFRAVYGAARISQSTIARCMANFVGGARCVLTRAPTGRPRRLDKDAALLDRFHRAMAETGGKVTVRKLGKQLGVSYSTAANMKRAFFRSGDPITGLRLVDPPMDGKQRYARVHSYPCKLCGAKQSTKLALKQHLHDVHIAPSASGCGGGQSEPPPDRFQCDQCDKSFATEVSLIGHRPSHMRQKYKEASEDASGSSLAVDFVQQSNGGGNEDDGIVRLENKADGSSQCGYTTFT